MWPGAFSSETMTVEEPSQPAVGQDTTELSAELDQ
jgi:hypothetical protein